MDTTTETRRTGHCCQCGTSTETESYSSELRRWRWWCRQCLADHDVAAASAARRARVGA